MRVHLRHAPEPEDLDVFVQALDPRVAWSSGVECEEPERVDVLVDGRPGEEGLARFPAIRRLVVPYAGIPVETRELLLGRPEIAVHNLHHNAGVSAEMAVCLLLAASKMVVPMDRALRRGSWSGRGKANPAVLLDGRTALILGYGAIGRRVAAAVRALGMKVLAVRRRDDATPAPEGIEVHCVSRLRDLLPRAQALVVCVPLTEETRGLLGRRELALLPGNAVLVNVGRGPVVDEKALYEALRTGALHSAGIDVWYRYPGRGEDAASAASRGGCPPTDVRPAESPRQRGRSTAKRRPKAGRDGDPDDTPPSGLPFHELENVVMSPHRGGWLHEAEALRMRHLADLLNALARGEEDPGRVDLAAGY